ncbi:RluA family pseudouridine synthase [bacterium]|nr:RluA family pseudouridine synthase [bacterium]
MSEIQRYEALQGDGGCRLDVVLARALGLSRTRVSELCRSGQVSLEGGRVVKPSWPVTAGEVFSLPCQEPVLLGQVAEAEDIPLNVVYEDEHLLVIDKPAGMVVHPAPGHRSGTLVNALVWRLNRSLDPRLGSQRPGIVHRLDKDTSGLLVVARTFEALESLSEQIRTRRMSRLYMCVSWGRWPEREGTLEGALARSRADRKKITVTRRGGLAAVTHYRVLETYDGLAELVRVRLETGRTHQIRVHFAHSGHPVLGDQEYGGRNSALTGFAGERRNFMRALLAVIERQALHAYRLEFAHPADGRAMEFESPLPEQMQTLIAMLRETANPGGGA